MLRLRHPKVLTSRHKTQSFRDLLPVVRNSIMSVIGVNIEPVDQGLPARVHGMCLRLVKTVKTSESMPGEVEMTVFQSLRSLGPDGKFLKR